MTDYPITRLCPQCHGQWLQQGPRAVAPAPTKPMVCDRCRGQKSSYTKRAVLDTLERLFTAPPIGNAWRLRAVCNVDTAHLFYPDKAAGFRAGKAAKAVCAACPVQQECLQYALETQQQHGIWGGLSREERYALNRRLKAS